MINEIYFGAGCFWGVQDAFKSLNVEKTEVGYTNGAEPGVTYKQVCSGNTGHNEVVRVVYDEDKVSLDSLLNKFFEIHDPSRADGQGPDVGDQYRSGIYFVHQEQELEALFKIGQLNKSMRKNIVTEVLPVANYTPAEDYHQDYNEKRGGFCGIRFF